MDKQNAVSRYKIPIHQVITLEVFTGVIPIQFKILPLAELFAEPFMCTLPNFYTIYSCAH